MQIASIHDSVKQVIDTLAYKNVFTTNVSTSFSNVSGGTAGNSVLNPYYEFHYKYARASEESLNVYTDVGFDTDRAPTDKGGIVVRTFDVVSKQFLPDRIEIYNDPTWCVYEFLVWQRPNDVWIYAFQTPRSDPMNGSAGRIVLIKSTDGKVGRQFGTAAVQLTPFNYSVLWDVIQDNTGANWLYLTRGGGLYRCQIAADGTLGAFVGPLFGASGLTEGQIVDVGGGVYLAVARLDGGGFVQQSKSTDYGATWSALSSTGIGASTGQKITPNIIKCMNRPGNLITTFNDRGSGNRDRASSNNVAENALAGTWVAPSFIGAPATQGNSRIVGLSATTGEYLYCTARSTGAPAVTETLWWILKDNYATKVQNVAGWQ